MASVEFYDVKTRKKVKIDDKQVTKVKFTTKTGSVLYGLSGKTADGRFLTKLVSQKAWEKAKYAEG